MARYQPHDRFYRKAREQALPSRAAYKLEELLARFNLARAGARVADLGCAPGGWLVILSRAVGPHGRVAGVDLSPCTALAPNVVAIAGDLREPGVRARVLDQLGAAADLVTSDLSPKLTGIADRDQAMTRELLEAALDFAGLALKPGAAMIVKLFMGPEFERMRTLFAERFSQIDIVRTRATRPGSAELYLVARGFRRPAAASSG